MKTSRFLVKGIYLFLAMLICGSSFAASVKPSSVLENLTTPVGVDAGQTSGSLEEQSVKTFLKSFYDKYLFNNQPADMSFEKAVQTYCTVPLQYYLEEQYANVCPDGGCYERSCFLSGLQSKTDKSEVIKIIYKEDDWYLVLYDDRGNVDQTYLHCVLENGTLKMDKLAHSYDEVKKGPDYSGTYIMTDAAGVKWTLTLNKDQSGKFVSNAYSFYCSWNDDSNADGSAFIPISTEEYIPVLTFKGGERECYSLTLLDGYIYPNGTEPKAKNPNWRLPVKKIK